MIKKRRLNFVSKESDDLIEVDIYADDKKSFTRIVLPKKLADLL